MPNKLTQDNLMNNSMENVVVSFAELLENHTNFAQIADFYQPTKITNLVEKVIDYLNHHDENQLDTTIAEFLFVKPFELDIYVTEPDEGRQINLEARGKDYATNILSYPNELPNEILSILPTLPLGELVICHDVVVRQADEQGKTVEHHLTHLLIHGILHLLGFDHELGQTEQDEMEHIEITILQQFGIANPYE